MVLMETAGETIKHLLLILFLGPSERKGRRGGGKRPHPLLHKVVSCNYSCTVHFDHSIRRAHAPHRSLGCRTQERRKPHSGLPWAKNRNTPRSSPARSAQMPRNPTREAGSSWNVPDASDGKNPFII